MYCYRRHSSPQISRQLPRLRLLSAAHFPAQRHRAGIVIHGTIPGFTGIFPHFFKSHRVVIRHTILGGAGCVAGVVIIGTFCGMGCYPWHIFHFVDFLLCVLLSAAQFRKNPLAAFSGGCYPPHNFCRTRRGQGCYPQHSFDSGNFFVRRCYARHISEFRARCCYQRHNSLLFLWGCYSAHNSPKAPMSRRVLERTAHFKNPVLLVVIGGTILFSRKNPAAEFLQKKYFFALLHPAHGYFRHSFVVISGTIGLERAAHFCCNIRHSYTYFLNIYKYLIKISKRKNADFGRRKRNVSSVTIIDTCNTICYYTLIVL